MKTTKNLNIWLAMSMFLLGMGGMAGGSAADSNSIVEDGIEYYIQTNKSVYDLGDDVEIVYRVTNLGEEDVEFRFSYGPIENTCDLMVDKDELRIWDNQGRPATAAFTSFNLSPSESYQYTHTWDMTYKNGNNILSGNYNVTAVLGYPSSHERYVPLSIQIEIIPELAMIYYVDADANGVNDGSSWTDAYNYLQDALTVSSSGDEIWVAQGIYKPDQGVGITPGDRTATFQLINGVAIRGGYAGFGEPDTNERDIDAYETILSGDLNGDDGSDFANNDENNYHVVTSIKTDETAILDGFTIVGGNTHPSDVLYPQNSGGGMYNESGSPTLINCTFKENHSYYLGGGLCNDSGSPRLINCGFVGNLAKEYCSMAFPAEGGAIYNRHGSPTITNCTFTGNWASYWGGGMTTEGGNPRLANCTFAGNYAYNRGGAIAVGPDTSLTLTNCTFGGNLSTHGHVLSCYSWFQQPVSSVRITNCILWNGGKEIASCEDWTVTISYSDVYGGRPGKGNVDVDPCFADANNGDYHLLEDSPCIDTGDPNYIAEPNETDLDGKPRVLDGNEDGIPIVDMGAYEYRPLISAEVRIVPRTINLQSKGKWITCYIWLGEEYDVADIDPNSVLLEGEIQAESILVYEQQQIVIVRFSRSEVQGILNAGQVELTISGELTDGTVFEGTDVIRVIDKGKKKNQPPNVTITKPQDGAVFGASETIEIEANAWDIDGSVVKVEFFADESKIGEDNDGTDGWKTNWSNHPVGSYSLTAKAIDDDGATATSPAVGIMVVETPLPGQASNPNPADGATRVSPYANLSWTTGSDVTSHDVYFGTTSPGTFRGNQTATTFDPGTMAGGATYYWRIDEVNKWGKTTGTVWSFITTGGGPR